MPEQFLAAVIWDMDGTLVDTGELHFQAWLTLAQQLQKPFTRADFARTFGWRNPEIIPTLFGNHLNPQEVEELGRRKEELYRTEAAKGVELLPGGMTLVADLHKAGFRQAIGSSAPRANLEMILDHTGTRTFFGAVVAMEDTQRGKPDPEVFLRAAQGLGVPPERCIVLEDAPAGVQAARAGGMYAVGITFVGHHPEESLRRAGANLVVPSLEHLNANLLRRLLG